MERRVRVERQVRDFGALLAPEPRKALLRAIKDLARRRGDVKRLEGRLASYSRLRAGNLRVIFQETTDKHGPVIVCVYANFRPIVYQLFGQLLADDLASQLGPR